MADTILYDQQNLEKVIADIEALGRRLSGVSQTLRAVDTSQRAGGEVDGGYGISLSGLALSRVEGGSIREQTARCAAAADALADYHSRLARAVRRVGSEFERVEGRQAGLAETSDGGSSGGGHSGGGGRSENNVEAGGDWTSRLMEMLRESLFQLGGVLSPTLTGLAVAGEMLWALITGQEVVHGAIREWDFPVQRVGGEDEGAELEVINGRLWDNNLVSLTWQEVEVDGRKVRVLLPYINIGTGGEATGLNLNANTPTDWPAGVGVGGNVGSAIIGHRLECGFVDGHFVFDLVVGVEGNVAEANVTLRDSDDSTKVGLGSGAGYSLRIHFENGVLTGALSAEFMKGVSVEGRNDIGNKIRTAQQIADSVAHGDFVSAARGVLSLMS